MTTLKVLYEDHHLLVVDKPAPLLTQAPAGVPSLEALAKDYIKEKYAKPAGVYLAVPHRLDRPVSGVVCFVRNSKAATRVHDQFHDRSVGKTYWAMIEGSLTEASGVWEDWIAKVPGEARAMQAEPHGPDAKHATLEYAVLKQAENHTLIELRPRTGRMHQLRVQCAWRGHPVLGDTLYGSTIPFGEPATTPRDAVIALHARKLEFTHPFNGKLLSIEAPLPETWDSF